jgi:hypothetical protein
MSIRALPAALLATLGNVIGGPFKGYSRSAPPPKIDRKEIAATLERYPKLRSRADVTEPLPCGVCHGNYRAQGQCRGCGRKRPRKLIRRIRRAQQWPEVS